MLDTTGSGSVQLRPAMEWQFADSRDAGLIPPLARAGPTAEPVEHVGEVRGTYTSTWGGWTGQMRGARVESRMVPGDGIRNGDVGKLVEVIHDRTSARRRLRR
ncbi:MAG: hypothetical protein KDC98_06610 [Planctomycetes bacterium]|nr:hypothetical protein [Planctomycetota bacterium]